MGEDRNHVQRPGWETEVYKYDLYVFKVCRLFLFLFLFFLVLAVVTCTYCTRARSSVEVV